MSVPTGLGVARAWPPLPLAGAGARRVAAMVLLLGVTFGQRFCFPYGTFQIPVAVPIAYLAIFLLLLSGRLRISTLGLALYATAVAAMIVTLYFGKYWFSPFSFWYLIVLYFIYIFSAETSQAEYLGDLEIYQRILVVLAVIALLQFAEQVVSGGTFSIFDYISPKYWLAGYNTRPTLHYGSGFYKANAQFFLEPSFLSQFMAVGIIIELLYFGRWRRILLYGVAIFTSFSGTGMALLLLFGGAALLRAKRYEFLYALPVALILLIIFRDNSYVTAITGRIGEFDSQQTSAFMRFIAPNEALVDAIGSNFQAFLVGKGPGAVQHLNRSLDFISNFPVTHKLLIEYGIVGFVPFMAFAIHRFFAGARSYLLAGALFFMYLFLSGSLLQPHTIYLFYVLSIMAPRSAYDAMARAPLAEGAR